MGPFFSYSKTSTEVMFVPEGQFPLANDCANVSDYYCFVIVLQYVSSSMVLYASCSNSEISSMHRVPIEEELCFLGLKVTGTYGKHPPGF